MILRASMKVGMTVHFLFESSLGSFPATCCVRRQLRRIQEPGAKGQKKSNLRLSYGLLAPGFWMLDTQLLAAG
jgi:hypothetical protein